MIVWIIIFYIEKIERFKTGLISKATNGDMDEKEYKELRSAILYSPILKNSIPNIIKSSLTAQEFRNTMQGMFDDYKRRRNFITEEMNKLIIILEGKQNIKYVNTGWDQIDNSVNILFESLNNISDRLSINEIGVRCRETLKLLANEIYVDELHHPSDYKEEISSSDTKRMFDGYLEYKFSGASNQEKRAYAKACNKLADALTHGTNVSVLDAKLCISATLSLIQLIRIIENK